MTRHENGVCRVRYEPIGVTIIEAMRWARDCLGGTDQNFRALASHVPRKVIQNERAMRRRSRPKERRRT